MALLTLTRRTTILALFLALLTLTVSFAGWRAQAGRASLSHKSSAVAAKASAAPVAVPLFATNIIVNSTADDTLANLALNATCDLREAIAAANTNAMVGQCPAGMAGLDTISFSVTGTITLAVAAGELAIDDSLTINGPGANLLTISGNNAVRVFNIGSVTPAINVTLSGLTIANGRVTGISALGGGILNSSTGTLNIINSTLAGNSVSASGGSSNVGSGGGIVNFFGTVNITNSTLSGNSASASGSTVNFGEGGGIGNDSGIVNITNSTLSGNSASASGGTNNAGFGGGIVNFGTVNITSSTLSGNSASASGGVNFGAGGGISNDMVGTVNAKNTIIAKNTVSGTPTFGPDVRGAFTSQGYNLIGDNSDSSGFTNGVNNDQVGTMATPLNPVLGPLAFNGGTTPTHRPLAGSTAIDKGHSFGLTVDQRGVTRPQNDPAIAPATGGDNSDIGAVELTAFASTSTITLTVNPATNPSGAVAELIDALNAANANPDATTINLVCGVYTLTARNNTFYGFTGLPFITSPVTIEGNGAVIERSLAAPSFRLLAIAGTNAFDPATGAATTPGNLTLRNTTLRNGLAQGGNGGDADDDGGGGGGAGLGGAIYNQGTLTVSQSALVANTARGGTGGTGFGGGDDGGGGGGGLGGNGGGGVDSDNGGSGGGGFGGNGGNGNDEAGGGGGGGVTDGGAGSGNVGGAGGIANGGMGGDDSGNNGVAGSFGGGGGGGGNTGNVGGAGGIGGGGGGAGESGESANGGFGGGGGGGDSDPGGVGGFGGGGGGSDDDTGGSGGFGAGNGSGAGSGNNGGGGGGGLGAGGAIFNDGGALTVINSTLSANAAQGGAGGLGEVAVGNGAPGQGLGGAVFARNGLVTINNVTLNNNAVTDGAGATVASGGGALYLLGDAQMVRVGDPTAVTFNVTNSILANTPGGANDAFVTTHPMNGGTATPGTNNNNLVRLNGASGLPAASIISTADPQLGALTVPNCAAGGCRTPVHPITNTSPAFNMAGGNALAIDQCGTTRPTGLADIGAFEVAALPPPLSVVLTDPIVCNGVGGIVIVTAQLTNPNPAQAVSSFTAMLPAELSAITGTCTSSTGACNIVSAGQVNWMGNLNVNQTVTIQYQALVANGTPPNTQLCVNSTGTIAGVDTRVRACGTTNCPPNNLNNPPANVGVSGQKAGSVLVYPYYTARAATQADTRLTLSNIGATETIAHLFFIDGTSCQQSDFFVCLTPNASVALKASEYDPETTGWLLVVAVDRQGRPVQNNSLIGNAFVRDGLYVDNYGAESFVAKSADVAVLQNNTARLLFNDLGYEAVPDQFAVEVQSPLDAPGQRIVTVGLLGDLTTSSLSGAAQVGAGLIFNGNEKPSGSFSALLSGNCQALTTISTSNPRVPGGMTTMIPSSQMGTLRFNVTASVGLLLTPRGAANGWHGIRALHKTHTTFSTLTIPVLVPVC